MVNIAGIDGQLHRNRWSTSAGIFIIPYNRQHLISNDYRKLQNETDLVDFFSPEYYQGEQASLKAISEAERIIKRTYESSFLFNRVNIFRDWKNPNTWDYQIYGEKFSNSWVEFCESEKIGRRNADGIKLLSGNRLFIT